MVLSSFFTNVYIFCFFYSVIVGMASGFCMLPITYIIYGYFGEQNSGNVSGILLGFFGIFAVIYIFLSTMIINPNNLEATIPYDDGTEITYIFDEKVAKNVPFGILA